MHKILLREVVIDVPSALRAQAERFWSGALDTPARVVADYPEFTDLVDPAALCAVGLQDVGDAGARLHLDIESDDVEAEVARLTRLGARELSRHRAWVVMHDPAGLQFCIVPPQSDAFAEQARSVE